MADQHVNNRLTPDDGYDAERTYSIANATAKSWVRSRDACKEKQMSARYTAKICTVPGEGIRFEPDDESAAPSEINEMHLLVLSIALALGQAGYDHHPTPRDPAIQTIEGVLDGQAVLPWQPPQHSTDARIICDIDKAGVPRCRVI